ncbi:MAG: GIY-YIG nuclease family protein [bacterium]
MTSHSCRAGSWYPPERLKSFPARMKDILSGWSRAGSAPMIYYVYVLQDDRGHLYKGMTNDIHRRLAEHRSGHTVTTRKMRNLKLAYCEKLDSFEDASRREKYLKSAAGRRFLKTSLPS